jgi:cupin 2 domain-containing protein
MKNIKARLLENMKEELIETIFQTSGFRIERIISHGQSSAEGFWYDQEENEWVIVIQGSAGLRFENQEGLIVLNPGDYLNIDSHLRHRVEWTDPDQETIWLAVYYPDGNKKVSAM